MLNIHIIFYLNKCRFECVYEGTTQNFSSIGEKHKTFISTNSYKEVEDFSETSRSVRMCRKLDYLF